MSANFSPLPDIPTYKDLSERLYTISDISESLQTLAGTILDGNRRIEGDGVLFLVLECAERIYKEASEIMGGIEYMQNNAKRGSTK